MSDVFTKRKRSEVMSLIRGRNNKETELFMMRLLRQHNIHGWRRQFPVDGKPDFAFPRFHIAIFIDGCFWHCCPLHFKLPKTNRVFWEKKLLGNKKRDRRINRILKEKGWKVLRFWQHELKNNPKKVIFETVKCIGS
jgi:DNA mismatch endonuclease (patch repair protein)